MQRDKYERENKFSSSFMYEIVMTICVKNKSYLGLWSHQDYTNECVMMHEDNTMMMPMHI